MLHMQRVTQLPSGRSPSCRSMTVVAALNTSLPTYWPLPLAIIAKNTPRPTASNTGRAPLTGRYHLLGCCTQHEDTCTHHRQVLGHHTQPWLLHPTRGHTLKPHVGCLFVSHTEQNKFTLQTSNHCLCQLDGWLYADHPSCSHKDQRLLLLAGKGASAVLGLPARYNNTVARGMRAFVCLVARLTTVEANAVECFQRIQLHGSGPVVVVGLSDNRMMMEHGCCWNCCNLTGSLGHLPALSTRPAQLASVGTARLTCWLVLSQPSCDVTKPKKIERILVQ